MDTLYTTLLLPYGNECANQCFYSKVTPFIYNPADISQAKKLGERYIDFSKKNCQCGWKIYFVFNIDTTLSLKQCPLMFSFIIHFSKVISEKYDGLAGESPCTDRGR